MSILWVKELESTHGDNVLRLPFAAGSLMSCQGRGTSRELHRAKLADSAFVSCRHYVDVGF